MNVMTVFLINFSALNYHLKYSCQLALFFPKEGLLSITRENMCRKYWLTACSSLPRKKVWLGELTIPDMTIAVDWDVKQQTKPKPKKKEGFMKSVFIYSDGFTHTLSY